MGGGGKLDAYRRKRDFSRTTEPGTGSSGKRGKGRPIFVIQKHDASTLHYDVRLEYDGVLASWAVPKGPSTDKRVRRLALRTEDHPLEYADFEGVIPEGSYGAGPVMVWDRGTYRNRKENGGETVPLKRCLEDGHVTVRLEGEKIRGGYAFIRTGKGGKKDGEERWLMVKMDDDDADARRNPVSTEPDSVKSGRSLEEIAAAGKAEAGGGRGQGS